MRVRFIFEPADLWVGFYWSKEKKRLYFLPIPMVGLVFDFKKPLEDMTDAEIDKEWSDIEAQYHKEYPKEAALYEDLKAALAPLFEREKK